MTSLPSMFVRTLPEDEATVRQRLYDALDAAGLCCWDYQRLASDHELKARLVKLQFWLCRAQNLCLIAPDEGEAP